MGPAATPAPLAGRDELWQSFSIGIPGQARPRAGCASEAALTVAAYTVAQAATETPRQTEYRLFAKVTKALIDAEHGTRLDVVRALTWNRRLWLTLEADCARDENRLPEAIRAGIISLALWVQRHTRLVLKGAGSMEPLIAVNRSIMEGLAGRT